MSIKWIGAILIIAGCGGFGFAMAMNHRKEEKALLQLLSAMDYMECELQYRLTPLPELCRQAAVQSKGTVGRLLAELALELESQIAPDVASCMHAALLKVPNLPTKAKQLLKELGQTMGRFDLAGQLRGLEAQRSRCRDVLEQLTLNRETRLRSYQTLGLCAGAALAILFV